MALITLEILNRFAHFLWPEQTFTLNIPGMRVKMLVLGTGMSFNIDQPHQEHSVRLQK